MDRRAFLRRSGWGLLGWGLAGTVLGQDGPPPLPRLREAERLDGPPIVSARAWAIADGRSGRFLWGARERQALPMASTTKIMTAHVVLGLAAENHKVLEEEVRFSEQADKTTGSTSRLSAGDRLPVRDLLYGLLLPSGNDASVALAEHFGPRLGGGKNGSPVAAFVAAMNATAKRLGLAETRYLDPHGLGKNLTSARDLTILGHRAMQEERFRRYVGTRRHRCTVRNAKGQDRTVEWNNTNRLLEMEGYEGIKTGTTTAAGACLVASGRHQGDHLFVVVLGSTSTDGRYVDARNLFRWAWRERRGRK